MSGSLSVVDLSVLQKLWTVPAVKKLVQAGMEEDTAPQQNRAERRRAPKKGGDNSATDVMDLFIPLMSALPHSVQARLRTAEHDSVWCSLQENNMITPSSELLLKHGANVSGEWSMLGVLDALPAGEEDNDLHQTLSTLELASSPMGQMMIALQPLLNIGLGRPASAYGVTPLLIFRSVIAAMD